MSEAFLNAGLLFRLASIPRTAKLPEWTLWGKSQVQ